MSRAAGIVSTTSKIAIMKDSKGRKALRRLKVRPMPELDRAEMDKNIFDVVLKYLYVNADKNELNLSDDILDHMTIKLPEREKGRIWGVLTSSAWVSPIVGFGNAGKIELTKAGFQLMSQFGSYSNYLSAVQDNPAQAAIVNAPISVSDSNKTAREPKTIPGNKRRNKE